MTLDVLANLLSFASTQPGATAVIDGDQTVSYGDFAALVRRYAGNFAQTSGTPKVLVNLNAGVQAYAAMFGALMAGGYYAPVNIEHPLSLRGKIAGALSPDVVVVEQADDEARTLAGAGGRVLCVSDLEDLSLEASKPAHEIAYVMFTSGSTGEPKGVIIPRVALNTYVENLVETIKPDSRDIWSQYANIGFDFSIFDIYGALSSGGALCAFSTALDRLTPAMVIKRHGITIWASVPSVVDIMSRSRSLKAENLASLRLMLFCGEPLLEGHLKAIFDARDDLPVWNTYGPTEATVFLTILKLFKDDYSRFCRGSAAIGEAIPYSEIHIWDEKHGVGGEEGELILCGKQLALGYIGDAERTAKAFRQVEINGQSVRAYFTGDWVRREDDQIYFVNRIDRQVKLNGYRIELGQIDSALRSQGFVSACTLLLNKTIVSFVESDKAINLEVVKQLLQKTIPAYMMPKQILTCELMPTNMNGKIDVKALSQLATEILS